MSARDLSRMTARYHTKTQGWGGHGYQFEIAPDGTVCQTGDVQSVRASVWGRNQEVISAVLVGNMSAHLPTDAQIVSLRWLRFGSGLIPAGLVNVGHKEIALPQSLTSCPGDTWPQWRAPVLLA